MKYITLILTFVLSFNLFAQQEVTVKLKQPPPNQLGAADLWNLELTNNTGRDLRIYLKGSVTEDKDGLIIEATSKPFTLKPGKSNFKYNDFSDAEIKYNNSRYKEIIIRTGNAPEGNYTICITAYDENNNEVGRENCIVQNVQQKGSITLLTPSYGEVIDLEMQISFSWTPLPDAKDYTIRIWELNEGESPEIATRVRKPIIEKSNITNNNILLSLIKLKETRVRKFVWQVQSGNVTSDYSVFTTQTLDKLTLKNFNSVCKGDGKYDFSMTVQNGNSIATDWIAIAFTHNLSTGAFTDFTIINMTITPPGTSYTSSTPITKGGDCNNSPTNYFTLLPSITIAPNSSVSVTGTVQFTPSQPVNNACIWLKNKFITNQVELSGSTYVEFNQCRCCDGFVRKVDSLKFSHNFISGILTAGPKPITKITAEMVYFGISPSAVKPNNPINCLQCVYTSMQMGNFYRASTIGSLSPKLTTIPPFNYSREVVWGNGTKPGINMTGGAAFSIGISMPPVSPLTSCCSDTVNLCIRFSFTDTSCVTCDTVICFRIKRDKNTNIIHYDKYDGYQVIKKSAGGLSSTKAYRIIDSIYINEDSLMMLAKDMNLDEDEITLFIEAQKDLIRNKEQYFRTYSLEELELFRTANQPGCFNGGFENLFLGWTGCTTVTSNINTGTIVSLPFSSGTNGHHIQLVGTGTDPIVPISQVHSGSNAVRLGLHNHVGSKVEILRKTFIVDPTTSNFTFWYALIMQDPGHGSNANPYFEVKVKDAAGNPISGLGFKHIADLSNPFWQKLQGTSIVFRDWTCAQIDLSSQIGQTVTVEFINADCGWGAHYACTYIDDICLSCAGSPTGSVSIIPDSSNIRDCQYPVVICGSYTLPFVGNNVGTLQNIYLYICHNGVVVNTVTGAIVNSTNGTYCFILPQSAFPPVSSPPDGYDFVVTAEFLISGSTIWASSSTPGNGITPGMNNDFMAFCEEPCCNNFNIVINSLLGSPISTSNNTSYPITATISTSPNNIKEFRVNIVNMYRISQRGCQKCLRYATGYGGLSNGSGIPWGSSTVTPILTKPVGVLISSYSSPRELVWKSPSGYSRPPFSNQSVKFYVNLPPLPDFTCCTDTVKFCIRYTFTDTTCRTCSRLICYTLTQKGVGKTIKDFDLISPQSSNDMNVHSEDRVVSNENNENQTNGHASGVINFDLESTSRVKLNIYDINGSEILNVFDNYLKEGQYSFDLNKFNLPDGVYFYKIEGAGLKKYEKVLISNQLSNCSCSSK